VLDVAGDSFPLYGRGTVVPEADGSRPAAPAPATTAGTRRDFRALYDEYFPVVWRWAMRLGVPASALDDVVQEIFLAIYMRIGEFEGRSSLKTWIFGVTLGVTRNFRRRRATRPTGDASGSELDAVPERAPHPEAVAQQSEEIARLQRILDGLDDEKREVFVLAELEGFSTSEIAEVTGATPNTVSSRLRLARQAVRTAWERADARDTWRLR